MGGEQRAPSPFFFVCSSPLCCVVTSSSSLPACCSRHRDPGCLHRFPSARTVHIFIFHFIFIRRSPCHDYAMPCHAITTHASTRQACTGPQRDARSSNQPRDRKSGRKPTYRFPGCERRA